MKKDFSTVLIIGGIAVGKYTTAALLAKKKKYTLFHNHIIIDLVKSLHLPNQKSRNEAREITFFNLLKIIAQDQVSTVLTHAYSNDYVSATGLSDPQYVKKVKAIIEKAGGKLCLVYLTTTEKEVLSRIGNEDRKQFKKLTNKTTMKRIFAEHDMFAIPKEKDVLVIDNTGKTPQQAVNQIIKHFSL